MTLAPRRRMVVLAPHFAEYALRLSAALSDHGPTLLVLDRDNRERECERDLLEAVKTSVAIVEFRSKTRLQRRLALALVILRIMLFRPDIVHVQEQGDILTATIVRVLRRYFRIVLTIHDPVPHAGNDAAYATRAAPHLALLRDAASLYHVHGNYCRRLVLDTLGSAKPVVSTAHGVLMVPTVVLPHPVEPGRILLFGRMEAYKGVEDLLDAADELASRAVVFRLVLAGRGDELQRLDARIRGSAHIILMSRFLAPAEAKAEFAKASVVVAPYRNATQSGVIAAAFGNLCPVVATRAGGLVDAIRDDIDGLLVPAGTPVALADAIERILTEHNLRDRLVDGVAASVRSTFNWSVIAQSLAQAYGGLVERR